MHGTGVLQQPFGFRSVRGVVGVAAGAALDARMPEPMLGTGRRPEAFHVPRACHRIAHVHRIALAVQQPVKVHVSLRGAHRLRFVRHGDFAACGGVAVGAVAVGGVAVGGGSVVVVVRVVAVGNVTQIDTGANIVLGPFDARDER